MLVFYVSLASGNNSIGWSTCQREPHFHKCLGFCLSCNHHRFEQLCEQIVLVNEQICRLRPVPEVRDEEELAERKKKLQERFAEKYKTR